jgi:hypothetical protein
LITNLEPQAQRELENSLYYQEIAQRGDQILSVVKTTNLVDHLPNVVVFFAAIEKDKGGTPVPAFSTIGVVVLQAKSGIYTKVWETVTEIESPFAYPMSLFPWMRHYFELFDLTKDSQPEIIVGGCAGFGNRCAYKTTVWSLDGRLLFDTDFDRFGGIQFLKEQQVIVTRHGLNIVGQAEAGMRPQDWQIDWYAWDGTIFAKTATKVFPYRNFDGPVLDNIPQ